MKRRDFIKAGTGAFFIAAAGKAIGEGAPSNRVRVAVIGCHEKGRGAAILKVLAKVPGIEVATVCDVDSRARDFAADFVQKSSGNTPKKEKDLRKVLQDKQLDAVISETPDHWHALSAVLAMRAGKHVYVEKPCAFCPREGEIILETWKKTGMVFQMGAQRRSSAAFLAAVKAIRDEHAIGSPKWGKTWYMTRRAPIGKGADIPVPDWLDWELWQGPAPRENLRDNLLHYNWHWFRNWGTGEAGNNSVHFVDIARWCLGVDYPERAVSSGGKYWIPADTDWEWPDTQNISWEFPGGKLITWEGLSCANIKPYQNVSTGAMIYGDQGCAFFSPGGQVEIYDLKGKNVVIVKCGMGKVNAGICAQTLISEFGCTAVINTGVAGSLDERLDIGDMVVSVDAVQHDFDVTYLGFERGEIPYTGLYAFPADEALRALAVEAVKESAPEVQVFEGRVCSGDQFISTDGQKETITSNFGGLCCEMEGGAIAQVCYLSHTPYVVLRAISDKVGETEYMDYTVFEAQAAARCAGIVRYMIGRI